MSVIINSKPNPNAPISHPTIWTRHNRHHPPLPLPSVSELDRWYLTRTFERITFDILEFEICTLACKSNFSGYETDHYYTKIFGITLTLPYAELERFVKHEYRKKYSDFLSLLGDDDENNTWVD